MLKKFNSGIKWLLDSSFLQLDRDDKIITESNPSTNVELENSSNTDLECPLLVPIGESLSEDGSTISYLEIPTEEAEKLALEEKKKGNDAFALGDYLQAITHYSKAIRLNCRFHFFSKIKHELFLLYFFRDYIFFSNRAVCYLKLGRYLECISDCSASIERKPNIKAYVRRAHAWESLSEYLYASDDFKRALKFEQNPPNYSNLIRCLKQLEQEYLAKLQIDPTSDKAKKSLQTLHDDIKHLEDKLTKPSKKISTAQYMH